MIACVDVDYRDGETVAACVEFRAWGDAQAAAEHVHRSARPPAAYEPGQFFRRELPYLLELLALLPSLPQIIVVDGHVWLAGERPGLGAHLHAALDGRAATVGVAKRAFHDANQATPVLRGKSLQPLYVSTLGIDRDEAAAGLRAMHGPHRLPTLLKRVDRLCRDG